MVYGDGEDTEIIFFYLIFFLSKNKTNAAPRETMKAVMLPRLSPMRGKVMAQMTA